MACSNEEVNGCVLLQYLRYFLKDVLENQKSPAVEGFDADENSGGERYMHGN